MSKESKKRVSLKLTEKATILKYSAGIDVSKEKFDVCLSFIDTTCGVKIIGTRCFGNTLSGFASFLSWAKGKARPGIKFVFVMEATGVYHENLAEHLFDGGLYVSVVLPNKVHKYLQSLGLKSKTDKSDAAGISRMGCQQDLELWKAPRPEIRHLRDLTRLHQGFQESKTVFKGRREALENGAGKFKEDLIAQLDELIFSLDEKITELEKTITRAVKTSEDLQKRCEKILKIKGISYLSLATILGETGAFEHFGNMRQLTSYAGYDVVENQSGKHTGRTKISKRGNSRIRRILHMPAFCVITHREPAFAGLWERVYKRTGHKMKAYTAVQRKLLMLIYTLWKKQEEYDPRKGVTASGNEEQEVLFSHPERKIKKKQPRKGAALDEQLPYKVSQEVLFSREQK